jgi:hypothetical protein
MNACLFTAIAAVTRMQTTQSGSGYREFPQTADQCVTLIVFGESLESAQASLEKYLVPPPEGENPIEVKIRSIVAAEFMDKLLTEIGPAHLPWPALVKQMEEECETIAADDFEQGYWVDVDTVVPPEQLAFSIPALQQGIPPDIGTGLNWSADKQFLYVLTVLSPPQPPIQGDDVEPDEESLLEARQLQDLLLMYPQGAEKEAVALIKARNSVVAAWLWRKFVVGNRLATNHIRIDPWCGTLGTPD